MKVLCLVGRSGVGKTSLLALTVSELQRRGYKVLLCKNSHHPLGDTPGTDSARLAEAGAAGVVLRGSVGAHLYLDPPPSLEDLLPLLASRYDYALIEGGKTNPWPKVELLGEQPAALAEHRVLATLKRGAKGPEVGNVDLLMGLLEREGQLVSASNSRI